MNQPKTTLLLALALSTQCFSLFAQNSQPKTVPEQKQAPVDASWRRVDVVSIPGRHKKREEQTSSLVDYDKAYFEGSFNGRKFKLECVVSKKPGQYASLLFTVDGKRQVLGTTSQTWGLVWAGDRDGDGKLDLIIQSVGDGGRTSSGIYLSSLAKTGELVAYSETDDGDDEEEEGC